MGITAWHIYCCVPAFRKEAEEQEEPKANIHWLRLPTCSSHSLCAGLQKERGEISGWCYVWRLNQNIQFSIPYLFHNLFHLRTLHHCTYQYKYAIHVVIATCPGCIQPFLPMVAGIDSKPPAIPNWTSGREWIDGCCSSLSTLQNTLRAKKITRPNSLYLCTYLANKCDSELLRLLNVLLTKCCPI